MIWQYKVNITPLFYFVPINDIEFFLYQKLTNETTNLNNEEDQKVLETNLVNATLLWTSIRNHQCLWTVQTYALRVIILYPNWKIVNDSMKTIAVHS